MKIVLRKYFVLFVSETLYFIICAFVFSVARLLQLARCQQREARSDGRRMRNRAAHVRADSIVWHGVA